MLLFIVISLSRVKRKAHAIYE